MSAIYWLIVANRKNAIEFCKSDYQIPENAPYKLFPIFVLERETIANLLEVITGETLLSSKSYEKHIPKIYYAHPNGPWLYEIPKEIVSALAGISTKSSLTNIARAWKEKCLLLSRWRLRDVLDLLSTIRDACVEADQSGKRVFDFIIL